MDRLWIGFATGFTITMGTIALWHASLNIAHLAAGIIG